MQHTNNQVERVILISLLVAPWPCIMAVVVFHQLCLKHEVNLALLHLIVQSLAVRVCSAKQSLSGEEEMTTKDIKSGCMTES